MSNCPVVLQVFFNHDASDWPDVDRVEMFGLPLWKPKQQPVCRWAVDYVVCSDERWIVFGPFQDRDAALLALRQAEADLPRLMDGYRLINAHCFPYLHGKNTHIWPQSGKKNDGLPYSIWTDG